MNKTISLGLWLLLLALGVTAAPKPVLPPPDRSPVVARRADAAAWERLRADREFQYGQDVKTDEESLLVRLWVRFTRWIVGWLYNSERKNTRDWLTLASVVGVAVFAIWKLMGMEVSGLFGRRGAELGLGYGVESENIHAIDFGEEISAALARQQYRLALRLHYLQTLKRLSDAEAIDWRPNKTNRTYVGELHPERLRPDFERLTNQFEVVWYGNLPLDATQFEAARRRFEEFGQALLVPSAKANGKW